MEALSHCRAFRTIPRPLCTPKSYCGVLVLDFEVQRFTRVCAKTDRALKPGDAFYSALVRDGSNVSRQDVVADAWEGPPEDCLAWWKSEVPDPKAKRIHWAPHDVMLNYFAELDDQKDQGDVRYLLSLLMIRRRIFRLEETETDDEGHETMILFCPRNENEYCVNVTTVSQDRAREIQDLLAQLLVDAAGKHE